MTRMNGMLLAMVAVLSLIPRIDAQGPVDGPPPFKPQDAPPVDGLPEPLDFNVGLELPYSGLINLANPGAGFSIENSGNGKAIAGVSQSGTGLYGQSTNGYAGRFDGLLSVNGSLQISGAANGLMFPDGSLQTTAAGGGGGGGGYWSPSGANIYSNNGGKVGIGTTAPLSKLDIAATGEGAELLRFSTERPWVFRQIYSGPSTGLQLLSTVGQKPFEITAVAGENVATFIADSVNSRVGIGTKTPISKLDIAAAGEGAELLRFSTERPWVFRQIYSGPSAGLQLLSTVGLKNFEITASTGVNVATFVTDNANPRVGIGTTAPLSRLDIAGQDALGMTGYQPFLTMRDSSFNNARTRIQNAGGNMHFFTEPSFATGVAPVSIGPSGNAIVARHSGDSSSAGVLATSSSFNGNGLIGEANIGNDAFGVWGRSAGGIGGYFEGGQYALFANGRAKVGVLEITGADVAEKFLSSDENIAPGTVMVIDPEHAGQLRVANEAYSSRVAGVVSGAGDIPVGAVLGNLPGHENAPPIALSGRVWVLCDATQAAITPGDLLTTSDTVGHAMKAADRERAYGTILGKSMSSLELGQKGLVLVLVNLQ